MKSFLMALQNITRIYIYPVDFKPERLGYSSAYFPLVGVIIGIFLYSVYHVSGHFFPPEVVAALVLVGHLFITGGMHLDGFMDSMDGLFSGRDKSRKLEIMKDSRVGANGVMTVVLLFLLKYTFILKMPGVPLVNFILMAAFSRWTNVYCFKTFPYVSPNGLGQAYKDYTGWLQVAVATLTAVVVGWLSWQVKGVVILLIVWLFTQWAGKQITKTIDGMTGDIYGFLIEFNELLVLFMIYVMAKINF